MKVRIRQLKNEKWVAEVKGLFFWRGIDASHSRHAWLPGNCYYPECWCDSEAAAEKAARSYMSLYGIGR
jgi:hypothetical protein